MLRRHELRRPPLTAQIEPMNLPHHFIKGVDAVNDWVGRTAAWQQMVDEVRQGVVHQRAGHLVKQSLGLLRAQGRRPPRTDQVRQAACVVRERPFMRARVSRSKD